MADTIAKFYPGERKTFTVAAGQTVTGGQLVEATGDRICQPAAAASTKVVGVAERDASAAQKTVVGSDGVYMVTASGAVAAGDIIAAAAAGQAAAIGAGVFGAKIGRALTAAANGVQFELQLGL